MDSPVMPPGHLQNFSNFCFWKAVMPGLEALRLASDRRDTLLLFPSFHEEFILMQAVPDRR